LAGNKFSAPGPDEAEISIFGPGIGECIVLHLGNFDWMIVDSCVEYGSQYPIALQYLKQIGFNVAEAVKCFVATHWHNDHIKGAVQIIKECPSAHFVCSSALRTEEFLQLVNLYEKPGLISNAGIEEFGKILGELKRRLPGGRGASIGPTKWASADRRLLHLPKNGRSVKAEVYALSPSDTAITLGFQEIGQLLPQPGMPKRRAVAQSPNHVSVALWVIIEDLHILLGSDLEHVPDHRLGWKAVLLSPTKPSGRAHIIKIPHHGSSNAYCRDVWTQMGASAPIGLLSPFSSGSLPLPTRKDLDLIRAHTPHIYITGSPNRGHPSQLDPAVSKTIREMVLSRRVIQGPMGHVRVRYLLGRANTEPTIDLFEGAKQL
jgi:hypothetical protein